ncbi:hypothetical protein IAU59_006541 [Kwoniella sp. CBS 9459]
MLTPPYHFSIVAAPSHLETLPTPASQALPQVTTQGDSQNPTQTQAQVQKQNAGPQILYRGSIPAQRNLSFLRRLRLRTLIYLKKKELKDDQDDLVRWAKKRGVRLKWVRAESMGEERLGMGKNEVGEVLKTILDPSSYPLYIADIDGISHTTLVVACLRKLQGWHMDSIINEICRFEPDHDDLPLVPFISSYLSPQSSSSSSSNIPGPSSSSGINTGSSLGSGSSAAGSDQGLVLPPPPYPTWLWPTPSSRAQSSAGLAQNAGSSSGPCQGQGQIMGSGTTLASASALTSTSTAGVGGHVHDGQRQGQLVSQVKTRDRTGTSSSSSHPTSSSTSSASATTTVNASTTPVLPFPHPLNARRHPTMKLAFPMLPPPVPSTTAATTSTTTTAQLPTSPLSSSPLLSPSLGAVIDRERAGGGGGGGGAGPSPGSLSRVPSRREKSHLPPPPAASPVLGPGPGGEGNSSAGAGAKIGESGKKDEGKLSDAVGAISAGLAGITNVLVGSEHQRADGPASLPRRRDQQENTNAGSIVGGAESDIAGSKLGRQVSFHSASERDQLHTSLPHQQTQGQAANEGGTMPQPLSPRLQAKSKGPSRNTTASSSASASAFSSGQTSSSPGSGSGSTRGGVYLQHDEGEAKDGTTLVDSPGNEDVDEAVAGVTDGAGQVDSRALQTADEEMINGLQNGDSQSLGQDQDQGGYDDQDDADGDEDEDDDDEEEEEEEDEDEEDEDEDEDDGDQPTSQYISALDLAGFG